MPRIGRNESTGVAECIEADLHPIPQSCPPTVQTVERFPVPGMHTIVTEEMALMQGKQRVAAPVSAVQRFLGSGKGRVDASQPRVEEAGANFEPLDRSELKLFVRKNDVARPDDSLRDSLQGQATPRSRQPEVLTAAADQVQSSSSTAAAFAPAPAALLPEERLHIPHKKLGALKPPDSFSFG
jgi:hypothetical protein